MIAADAVSIDGSSGWIGLAIAFVALSTMRIVLGIDNIFLIAIATSKLPVEQPKKARFIVFLLMVELADLRVRKQHAMNTA